MMTNHLHPTLQHEFTSIRNIQLPDFGLLKKQCIAFGESIPQPVDSINQVPAYESAYLHKVQQLKYNIPTPVQSHLWPILFRGRSATCVSAPKSGKTLSYLIPALSHNQFRDDDPNLLVYGDEGPKLVAVCSGMNKVYEIRDQVFSILDRDTRNQERIVFLTRDNENAVTTRVLNGCDVLIATPGSLKRLIDNGSVRFDICALLVFDDADKSFILQPELVQSIVVSYLKCYKKRLNISDDIEGILTAPMLLLADSWTKEVKNFSTKYMKNSIQIFGDLFEAAIAHDIQFRVTFAPVEAERIKCCADLTHSLLRRGHLNRIAIVCCNDAESEQVCKEMEDLDVTPVTIDSTKSKNQMPKLLEMSRSHPRAVTIITDDKVKEVTQLNFMDTLIHYSMPDHTDTFRSRFMLMSTLIKKKDPSINTQFLLSSINGNHAHFLCQSLRRIAEVPTQLESLKNVALRPLCDYYLAYGHCPFKSTFCLNRHQFKMSDSVNKSLPTDGQIRFEITHIITANQFFVRLIEYRDSASENGDWTKFKYQYSSIKDQLASLKDQTTSLPEKVPMVGKVYGLNVMGSVHRVNIVANLGQLTVQDTNAPIDEDTPYRVEVAFIDFGYHSKALSNQLIPLPKHLHEYPGLARRSYILGIKPTDNEIEWTHKPAESLTAFLREHRNLIATAWIRMQRKSIFWLDDMKIIQNLRHLKRNVVSWSPEYDLLNLNLAEKHEKLFPKVNTNQHELYLRWFNKKLTESVSQAFLKETLEFTFLTHFIDPGHFYVVKENDFKCLENLEKDLSKSSLKPLKAFVHNCLGVGLLEMADRKCHSRIKIVQHFPTEKLVQVFFPDWGDTYKIGEHQCFKIEEKFIKQLPFQAIKCSLVGVQGEFDPNLIYDLTRDPGEKFKTVLVRPLGGNKDDGYSVRVYYESKKNKQNNHFTRLSKWLVDGGHCTYTDEIESKEEVEVTLTNGQKEEEEEERERERERESTNELDSDADELTRAEKRCADKFLESISEAMKNYLLENVEPDSVQFDPSKISPHRKLILKLKRLQREKEEREKNKRYDGPNVGYTNRAADGSLLPEPTDLSNVLPYDPTSSESELDSDYEDFPDQL